MKVSYIVAAGLLVAGLAAQAEAMKELDVYAGNVGKWDCDAKEVGSGKAFKAGLEYTREFDGHTYVERYFRSAERRASERVEGHFYHVLRRAGQALGA